MNINNKKIKNKRKRRMILTPITMTIVSLGAFLIVFSIGISPELMGNSVIKKNSYIVNYNSNGGSGSIKKQVIKSGEVFMLKKNSFTKEGYTFAGWKAYRSDGMWDCYIDENKSLTSWTLQSYCNKYGYSLYQDGVYVRDLVNPRMQVTMFADWKKN